MKFYNSLNLEIEHFESNNFKLLYEKESNIRDK